jgi:hypothetical protein
VRPARPPTASAPRRDEAPPEKGGRHGGDPTGQEKGEPETAHECAERLHDIDETRGPRPGAPLPIHDPASDRKREAHEKGGGKHDRGCRREQRGQRQKRARLRRQEAPERPREHDRPDRRGPQQHEDDREESLGPPRDDTAPHGRAGRDPGEPEPERDAEHQLVPREHDEQLAEGEHLPEERAGSQGEHRQTDPDALRGDRHLPLSAPPCRRSSSVSPTLILGRSPFERQPDPHSTRETPTSAPRSAGAAPVPLPSPYQASRSREQAKAPFETREERRLVGAAKRPRARATTPRAVRAPARSPLDQRDPDERPHDPQGPPRCRCRRRTKRAAPARQAKAPFETRPRTPARGSGEAPPGPSDHAPRRSSASPIPTRP